MKKNEKSEAKSLRQKAEELLKKQPQKTALPFSEIEILKLIHNLEVHQIELELQNEELTLAKVRTELAVDEYTELYDFAPSEYFTLSQDGRIIQLNLQAAHMLGQERKYLINRPFRFFISDKSKPTFNLFLKNVFFGKTTETCEITISRDNNLTVNLQLTGIIQKNGEQCFITAIDITERKKAEESLQNSEKNLRSILDATPFPIALVDLQDDKIKFWSKSAMTLFGHTATTAFEWYQLAYPDPRYRLEVIEQWKSALAKAKQYESAYNTGEYQIACKDGSVRICELYATFLSENLIVTFNDITHRKLAQNELFKSEAEFRMLAESVPQIVWITRPDGWNIYFNQQWVEYTGLSLEESYGHGWNKPFHPDDQKRAWDAWQNAVNYGATYSLECRLRRADGVYKWWLIRGVPQHDENGAVIKWFGTCTDINELKRSEKDLRYTQSVLQAALDHSQAGIAIADASDGLLRYVNDAALLIRGGDRNEIVEGIGIDQYFSSWQILDLDRTPLKPEEVPLARAIIFGEKNSKELIVRRDINDDRIVLANAAPIKDESGNVIAGIVVFVDITEQKQIEISLRKSEEELRKAQKITHVGNFYVDFATNKVTWTEELYKMYGFDPTLPPPLLNESQTLFTPESWELLSASIANTGETGVPYEIELKTLRKDASHGWMWAKGEAIRDNNGKITGIWGAVQDISNRKFLEEELIIAKEKAEESDRLKSAFLANMSHEIRTPMNGILGFASLLKEPGLNGEEQQKYIQIIEKSGARMLNIINNIIDISKIEAGLMVVDLKESNINDQIEYMYTFFKPEVEAKGMQLFFKNSLTAKEALIETDREKIYAILTNLVKNAIKYTFEGSIEFGYEKKGEYLEFFVKDTGIGIDKNRLEAIFERFIQADIEDTHAYQGAGLGLSITKAYVEMLGGRIWVESKLGKGSIFYFTIPYNAEKEQQSIITNVFLDKDKEGQIINLKILIVEDDEASEMFITTVIKKFNQEVLYATTGIEAIEACRNNPEIDLVLMDIRMPGMGGYEATRQIRQFNKDVIIIAQTAYGLSGDRQKAIEAGCNDYISKPIDVNLLKALIKKYFK